MGVRVLSATGFGKFLTNWMYFKTIYSKPVRVGFLIEESEPGLVFFWVLWLSLSASFHHCFILIPPFLMLFNLGNCQQCLSNTEGINFSVYQKQQNSEAVNNCIPSHGNIHHLVGLTVFCSGMQINPLI